ncbi:Trypsin-7 [Folsomia candida]|uniref:Trypsin-7 n=1 Tax=Folsomia candida TaxID=158441 RepID=A0A226CZX9_FOLCA|nr:Trypsin-7 [Folsomia candida]
MLKTTIVVVGVAVLLCIVRDINSHPSLSVLDAEGVLGEEEHGNRTKRSMSCTNYGCHKNSCGTKPEAHREWCWTTRGSTWDLHHCTEYDDGSLIPAGAMSVRAGSLKHSSGGQVYKVGKVIRNPGYNREASFDGDIAILQLTSTIWFGFGKTWASLSYKEPEAGTTHVVTGWGRTSESGKDSDVLQYANIPIVSRSECQKAYPDEKITDNMICGGYPEGGKDSCKGDSGGPLTRQWSNIQAGITSWGYGCARPGK